MDEGIILSVFGLNVPTNKYVLNKPFKKELMGVFEDILVALELVGVFLGSS